MRTAPLALAATLLLALATHPQDDEEDVPTRPPDLAGVWHSDLGDLMLRATSELSFYGTLAEGDRSRTWHFQSVGGRDFQFHRLLEGKATTLKLDEQRLTADALDELTLTLPVAEGKTAPVKWTRILAPLPRDIAGVRILFAKPDRGRVPPDQDVDIRLVRAFERAVAFAKEADPGLSRIEVAGTVDVMAGVTKRHSRLVRAAISISRVNGSGSDTWREQVGAALDAIASGGSPTADPRKDAGGHATALTLAFLATDGFDQVACPAVLGKETGPWIESWIARHSESLPEGSPSVLSFRTKCAAMLETTASFREKMEGVLFAAVPERNGGLPVSRKALEKRWDRP